MPPRLLLPSHPQAPRLLMTRAEFEAADKPGTRVEWLGNSGETRHGEVLGRVWPVHGFDSEGRYAMATGFHSEIVANLVLALGTRVDRDLIQIATQDAEVGLPTGRTRFPDVVLTPRPVLYAPHVEDKPLIVLNPAVVFEVLSESTAAVDEEDKPADYLSVETITDYVVIDQDRRRVRHRRRAGATPASWEVRTLTTPEDFVRLAEPNLEIPLSEIYARVPLPAPAAAAG